jgi:DNA-binding MarR family transcriptional regulator
MKQEDYKTYFETKKELLDIAREEKLNLTKLEIIAYVGDQNQMGIKPMVGEISNAMEMSQSAISSTIKSLRKAEVPFLEGIRPKEDERKKYVELTSFGKDIYNLIIK